MISESDILHLGAGIPRPSGSVGETLSGYLDAAGSASEEGAQGGLPEASFSRSSMERRRTLEAWRREQVLRQEEALGAQGALPIGDPGVAPFQPMASPWIAPAGMGRGMPAPMPMTAPAPTWPPGMPMELPLDGRVSPIGRDIIGRSPAPFFGGPGGAVPLGLRQPWGDDPLPEAPDLVFLATGFRRSWGEPRDFPNYFVWNRDRYIYEPRIELEADSARYYPHVIAQYRENMERAKRGIYLQPFKEEDAGPWLYRWVQTYLPYIDASKPYTYYAPGDAFEKKPPPRWTPPDSGFKSSFSPSYSSPPSYELPYEEPVLPPGLGSPPMSSGDTGGFVPYAFAKHQEWRARFGYELPIEWNW